MAKEEAKNKHPQIKKFLDFFLSFSKNRLKTINKQLISPAITEKPMIIFDATTTNTFNIVNLLIFYYI